MTGLRRRLVWSLLGVAFIVIAYTVIYRWAMITFEGAEITVLDSLQVVIEALTTAGFGGDTGNWNTDAMNLIVIAMNVSGVLVVFLALPFFIVPLIQQGLQKTPPETTDRTDHLIICSYTPRQDVLRSELEATDIPYVIIEENPETVTELTTDGTEAMLGDLEEKETFRAANIDQARGLVTDVSDERNVSVILTARELRDDLKIVSVAESKEPAVYHRYAGADRVVRPRQVLGRRLGEKVVASATRRFQTAVELGEDFELSEVRVEQGSPLAGQTLAESGLRDRFDVSVIALWDGAAFVPAPDLDFRLEENTILLVAGHHRDLTEANTQLLSSGMRRDERIVVVGYGEVGKTVVETLDENGLSYDVLDRSAAEEVDVVGDITDEETHAAANIETAQIVVLAIDDDTATMYTTVALERLVPDAEVIVRVEDVENTKKLYQAGAEYVLGLSTVTGRMLSSILLDDEEVLTPGTQFEIIRTEAPNLVGKSIEEAAIRERTGATVVAVERPGELLANPDPDYTVREDDVLVVAGSDEAVNMFTETFKR